MSTKMCMNVNGSGRIKFVEESVIERKQLWSVCKIKFLEKELPRGSIFSPRKFHTARDFSTFQFCGIRLRVRVLRSVNLNQKSEP